MGYHPRSRRHHSWPLRVPFRCRVSSFSLLVRGLSFLSSVVARSQTGRHPTHRQTASRIHYTHSVQCGVGIIEEKLVGSLRLGPLCVILQISVIPDI